jgi:3-phosphoshikimate 1-carboxyvinyltransferase
VSLALKLCVAKKIVSPGKKIEGVVEFPGDKSISHRYAILAALAEGPSELHNYASAADCQSTLDCLKRLNVKIERDKNVVRITGAGLDGLKSSRRALDAGNSGTTIRLMAGMLAGQTFGSELTGDSSLRRRPMRRILTPLAQMGAVIRSTDEGHAPLKISGAKLHAIDYTVPTPSAQVKSAVLLAGLYADGVTTVRESYATRDHTEIALREFGAHVSGGRGAPAVHSRPHLIGRSLLIPGDLSAAVFFIGAALILPDSSVLLHNVGLNPTRTRILDFLISMGASIHLASVQLRDGELTGDVAVRHAKLEGGKIDGAEVAEMIDELPMVAALGPVHRKWNRDPRRAGTAGKGKRPHRRAHRGPAPHGRAGGRISGRHAGGRPVGRAVARRDRGPQRRSPNRDGAGGGRARRGRRYHDSGLGVRGSFIPRIF